MKVNNYMEHFSSEELIFQVKEHVSHNQSVCVSFSAACVGFRVNNLGIRVIFRKPIRVAANMQAVINSVRGSIQKLIGVAAVKKAVTNS